MKQITSNNSSKTHLDRQTGLELPYQNPAKINMFIFADTITIIIWKVHNTPLNIGKAATKKLFPIMVGSKEEQFLKLSQSLGRFVWEKEIFFI